MLVSKPPERTMLKLRFQGLKDVLCLAAEISGWQWPLQEVERREADHSHLLLLVVDVEDRGLLSESPLWS